MGHFGLGVGIYPVNLAMEPRLVEIVQFKSEILQIGNLSRLQTLERLGLRKMEHYTVGVKMKVVI